MSHDDTGKERKTMNTKGRLTDRSHQDPLERGCGDGPGLSKYRSQRDPSWVPRSREKSLVGSLSTQSVIKEPS